MKTIYRILLSGLLLTLYTKKYSLRKSFCCVAVCVLFSVNRCLKAAVAFSYYYSTTHPIDKQVFSEESVVLCGSLCTALSAGA